MDFIFLAIGLVAIRLYAKLRTVEEMRAGGLSAARAICGRSTRCSIQGPLGRRDGARKAGANQLSANGQLNFRSFRTVMPRPWVTCYNGPIRLGH